MTSIVRYLWKDISMFYSDDPTIVLSNFHVLSDKKTKNPQVKKPTHAHLILATSHGAGVMALVNQALRTNDQCD